jgi:signal transduction histidine kinase
MNIGAYAFLPAYGIDINPVGAYLIEAIAVLILSFAILKYHLFEIKVILTEMLVGAMGIVLGIFVFIGPVLSPNLLRFLSLFVFFFFLLFAYLLLKSVYKEEKLKEKVIALAKRERELRIGEQRLRHARDQFILSSQHYFRTPISSIIGYLQLVFQGFFGKVPEKMEEKLKNVYQSSLTLRDRIEECLEIALLQLKKAPLLKEEVSLKEIIDEIINETKLFFERKNLTLETIFPQEPLPSLYLDKKRIKEALFNLVDNAIKHTDQGKITLSLEKRDISLKLGNIPSILFIVKDTGVGIKKEELAFLGTAPFERGEGSRNLTMLGKGIGLYLSRLIIEAHQGKLWLESEGPNKGTTCFVELPLSQKPEKTE